MQLTNPRILAIYAQRAAAAGLTVDEWHARNRRQAEEQAQRAALVTDPQLQLAVIAQHAARQGRRFELVTRTK